VIGLGPYQRESSEMRSSIAAVRVNTLKADPAWRPVPPSPVARFTCDRWKFLPPTIASTAPVRGLIATSAPEGSPGVDR
jgi:hypothetical protein